MKHFGHAALLFLAFPIAAQGQFAGGMGGSRMGPHPHHRPMPLASFYAAPFLPWSIYSSPIAFGNPGLGVGILPPVVVDTQLPPPVANGPRGPGMPGDVAGRFRPVLPADRDRARQPVRPEMPPPPRPLPPDPKAEYSSLIGDGRRAFAAGEYGRAAELFRAALAADPGPAEADLLLGQALIALGKYADAAAVIVRGVDRRPDWPTTGSPLRDLYAGRPQLIAEHLRALEDAAAADPGDPILAFLRAYVRWFEGERDEARTLFRNLRDRVTRPDTIDRFLGS